MPEDSLESLATLPSVGHLIIRRFDARDSLAELTAMIRRAYQQLADRGLRYTATWQDEEITAKRIEGRECFVAELEGALVGTIALTPPGRHGNATPWYANSFVAVFGQFGVEPRLQRRGIGARLLERVERRAVELGATELALDTAEPAKELIATYTRRGYRFIEYAQWKSTNYRSVILSRRLEAK
jgi:GNAT superfamily N-acetyltransferase